MPFALLFVGILLVVSGVRGKQDDLFKLLKSDFTGDGTFSHSFVAWLVAIGVIGGLGYFKAIRPIANAFLVLVILVLFLSNKGFFSQFSQQLNLPFGTQVNSKPASLNINNPFNLNIGQSGMYTGPQHT